MLAESEHAVSNGDPPKLRAACENCRQSKVKCNLSGKDTCIRCLRHGLPCRYRVANRSGKPKGSKNRATLRKLGQLQDEKKPTISTSGWTDAAGKGQSHRISYDADHSVDAMSPQDTSPTSQSNSPDSHGANMTDTTLLTDPTVEYPPLGETLPSAAPVFNPTSMSPTFLQKEFITKGFTSCPLAVHIPNTLQPCECSSVLFYHGNRLRHMLADSIHLRLDQMLQGIKIALTVCRGFLQCPNCHKDNTNLLFSVSILEITLQLFEYCIRYEFSSQSASDHSMIVGYGEYEMSADETRRIRRFLVRGRLLQGKEVLGLLKEAVEMSGQMSPELRDLHGTDGLEGEWLQTILMGQNKEERNMDRLSQITSHLTFPHGLLANQVAIITGAGQGIGAETARLFANEGAKVIIADIDAEKASSTATLINSIHPNRALAVPGDILSDIYITDLIQKAAEFGNGKIHIIVNNAGFTWDGVIHKMTDKQWTTILAIHNTAPFKLIRAAAGYFRVKDGESRVVINISSTSGVHGNAGQANYAVAKAGIIGLTKTIAKEWGPAFGVRANTIAFGFVSTRLTAAKEDGAFITTPDGTKVALGIPGKQLAGRKGDEKTQAYPDIPLGRPASAEEAAWAILGVASPLFSYVSGETIRVTGGRNM
ncbi:3-oxoacyl-reductase [Aspergillus sclerotioniger CBS 115572]|uniref:3-oxoacyl-reductase n=1 Tax=Aspergillus sclerotioniger CBS 115572 TaxID=1450535 RepID=A0A317VP47_9EURO|nr:3-oxoacyl-reductase [Aspergillus sclerotioniger CBS 115572]PWY74622.1 3-oxoacyl-reductase [Aspergillus sclerotioniger CBS 115572]